MPVAIVTGSDSGIGKATAVTLAQRGFDVGITWHEDEDGAKDTAREVQSHGRSAEVRQADLSDVRQGASVVAELAEALGGIDVLVNNAALELEGTIEHVDVDAWDRVMRVNLRGPFLCAKHALDALRERRGAIINIASIDGHWAEPELAAYVASKGGLLALTRAIAVDHGHEGVRCTAICPSYVRTDMLEQFFDAQADPARARAQAAALHAVDRISEPEEIASLAAWLASDEATFASGQAFVLDGGMTSGRIPRRTG
jgi:NAD(P)-dependent dehydrogenase (short-subunit alcohol dehydrogenase family)